MVCIYVTKGKGFNIKKNRGKEPLQNRGWRTRGGGTDKREELGKVKKEAGGWRGMDERWGGSRG